MMIRRTERGLSNWKRLRIFRITHASTFYLLNGLEPNQPIDLTLLPMIPDHDVLAALKVIYKVRQDLQQLLSHIQEEQRTKYKIRHKEKKFKVGELVLLRVEVKVIN